MYIFIFDIKLQFPELHFYYLTVELQIDYNPFLLFKISCNMQEIVSTSEKAKVLASKSAIALKM